MKIYNHFKYQILLRLFCLLCGITALTQEGLSQQQPVIAVNGTVVDQTGEFLPGASVFIEGTTIGTVTDAKGNFALDVSSGQSLVVSFISYETKKLVVTPSLVMPLSLVMQQDVVTLNETVIVAVGYGTMRKSDLTGAIASIPADKLRQGVITSTEQVLQGRIAGLTVTQGSGDPAAGSSIRLRGGTSLTASNSPLVVVDGIPGVDINTVHP